MVVYQAARTNKQQDGFDVVCRVFYQQPIYNQWIVKISVNKLFYSMI